MDKEIVIKPTFDTKSIFRGTLHIYNTKSYIMYFIVLVFLLSFRLSMNNSYTNFNDWVPLIIIMPLAISIFIYKTYSNSKKQINENPRIRENIVYSLTNDFLLEKGESFEIKHYWRNLFQIVEKKDMFLIYTVKKRALLIKKSDLKDNQYNELKALFNSLNITKSLR